MEFFRLAIHDMAKTTRAKLLLHVEYMSWNKISKGHGDLNTWALPEDELTLLAIIGIKLGLLKDFIW